MTTDRWSALTTRVLAPNPSHMTLDGTNSYLVRAPGSSRVVVVDPGPADEAHLARLAAEDVELILITHHHHDHTEGVADLVRATGAPARALDPALCVDGAPLTDGEVIEAAGTSIVVIATPGHTADSVSFHLPDDALRDAPRGSDDAAPGAPVGPRDLPRTSPGSVLTGDTILGRGTTIIAPDGSLRSYLASLDRLAAFGDALVLPAHGDALPSLARVCDTYRRHRSQRLDEVRAVLAKLELDAALDPATIDAVVEQVYGGIAPQLRFAADASVRAQLEYLSSGGV